MKFMKWEIELTKNQQVVLLVMFSILVVIGVFAIIIIVAPEEPDVISAYDTILEQAPECDGQIVIKIYDDRVCGLYSCTNTISHYLMCESANLKIEFNPYR